MASLLPTQDQIGIAALQQAAAITDPEIRRANEMGYRRGANSIRIAAEGVLGQINIALAGFQRELVEHGRTHRASGEEGAFVAYFASAQRLGEIMAPFVPKGKDFESRGGAEAQRTEKL